jgi:uncharacterized membrane protein YdjX (TVP38/TMEM64 family)
VTTVAPGRALLALGAVAVLATAGVFALLGGSAGLDAMLGSILHGNLDALRADLHALGARAALAVFVLVLAHTVLPFPAELLAASAGFALGPLVALPILVVSFLVSAFIAYLLGAWLGRPVLRRLLGAERLRRAEDYVERGGVRALLAVRLFPLVPFSPVCVACGLAGVPARRYLWTTAAGMLPQLALVTVLGARLQSFSLDDPMVWGPLAGLMALVVAGPQLIRRRRLPA